MTRLSMPPTRIALFAAAGLALVAVAVGAGRQAGDRDAAEAPAASPAPAAPATAAAPAAGAGGQPAAPDLPSLITRLEARLREEPDRVEGWTMLGWAFFETGRPAEAATAYRRAVRLAPDRADLWSALGEALVIAGGPGARVPADAAAAFRAALARDPRDARARYFAAVVKDQAGDTKGAVVDWLALLAEAPADAPWAAELEATIRRRAAAGGIDVAAKLAALPRRPAPPAAAAPMAAQPAAAAIAADPAQQAMIRGMVDGLAARLAADPRQPERWVMLMRSRMQLGEAKEAATALSSAVAANPGAAADLKRAAREMGVPGA
ncbi:tetratricopeptide repeat protein [Sphingomonas changnyeongensis]|uniref:Tetratricopeptide repeat protein n=1 Tax=Sphingomonas changnyeongensis TaxID=2698679 RepID=A0A7Z2NWC6_9SPHN|nr:tetratricopeptide repeat protein [Sphingomonas changnyeongensis]QHL91041.1 tetratricopeptide repeat protein [Sphingomonas changnyeongensis]